MWLFCFHILKETVGFAPLQTGNYCQFPMVSEVSADAYKSAQSDINSKLPKIKYGNNLFRPKIGKLESPAEGGYT